MLFTIILCFFSFAHGLQYYTRYDGYRAVPSGSVLQSNLNGYPAYSSGGLTVTANGNPGFGKENTGIYVIGGQTHWAQNRYPQLAYYPGYNSFQNTPNPALYSQNLPYYRNFFYGGLQGSYAPRYQQEYQAPVSAAIINTGRTVEYRNVSSNEVSSVPQVIDVAALSNPVSFNFRTVPSPIRITQTHTPGEASQVQQSQTVEQPQRLVHQLVRPLIHDVREIIQPFRHVTQEIQPVVENSRTVIARGEGSRHDAQNVAAIQAPVAAAQSVQGVQGVAQNENRLFSIDQQVGHVQVPANVEVRGQGVQPVGEVNNVPQQVGLVQNVQPVGVVSGSYQPLIGYSQQLPVVGVPYARNIDTPVASNIGIGSQVTGFRTDNGFASSGLVGALAAGGRSTFVQK
jgi:hypothetical protein